MEYEIQLGGQSVGIATVYKEGLYYYFDCRCKLTGEVIYRLQVCCGETVENLGIPVPEGDTFRLRVRIAAKRIGKGELQIRAVPKHEPMVGRFVPIYPEEPFSYLRRLENAFFQIRDGQAGMVYSKKRDDN